MSKEKLLQIYFDRNPALMGGKVTFTKAGLLKFFNTTYEEGYKQGVEDAEEDDSIENSYMPPASDPENIDALNVLRSIFKM